MLLNTPLTHRKFNIFILLYIPSILIVVLLSCQEKQHFFSHQDASSIALGIVCENVQART